jgi:hypothetical protein
MANNSPRFRCKSPIKGTIMLQAWVKPTQANGQNTTLLQLQDNLEAQNCNTMQNNKLTVT